MTPGAAAIVRRQLLRDEGRKVFPYADTEDKISIGIGRNLSDVGLHQDEIDLLFSNDLAAAEQACTELFATFDTLDDARQAVLVNLAFNLGKAGLAGFHHLIRCVNALDYDGAAAAIRDSKYAVQVGARADRLEHQMRSGDVI